MNWKKNTLVNHKTLQLSHRGEIEIEVVNGAAYITKEGDPKDYFIKPGESIQMTGRGLIVVEGFPNAEIQVCA